MAGRMWKAFGLASALTTAVLARRAIEVFWKVGTGREPPANPEDPDVEWKEAVAFALASGAAIGFARMLAARKAADYYRRSTGHLPANLQEVQ